MDEGQIKIELMVLTDDALKKELEYKTSHLENLQSTVDGLLEKLTGFYGDLKTVREELHLLNLEKMRREKNPDYSMDEAAKAFWDAVLRNNPLLRK